MPTSDGSVPRKPQLLDSIAARLKQAVFTPITPIRKTKLLFSTEAFINQRSSRGTLAAGSAGGRPSRAQPCPVPAGRRLYQTKRAGLLVYVLQ